MPPLTPEFVFAAICLTILGGSLLTSGLGWLSSPTAADQAGGAYAQQTEWPRRRDGMVQYNAAASAETPRRGVGFHWLIIVALVSAGSVWTAMHVRSTPAPLAADLAHMAERAACAAVGLAGVEPAPPIPAFALRLMDADGNGVACDGTATASAAAIRVSPLDGDRKPPVARMSHHPAGLPTSL